MRTMNAMNSMKMNENFVTLAGIGDGEYEEKNSRFIGYAAPISSEEEAVEIIKRKKKEYYDARHNVWAYILPDGTTQRYSDDGEPQGTGGMPTLSVISKRGICGAVVVVTRYFGGTLLGAGGLVRAYTQAASLALDSARVKKFDRFKTIEIVLSYSDHQKLGKLLAPFNIIDKSEEFSDSVTVTFSVKSDEADALIGSFSEISAGRWRVSVLGEKWGCICG